MVSQDRDWVLLSYRIPREPSTPRIAVWRKLTDLGVAKLGDGLVALPDDARTRERLEWVAHEVTEAGGKAVVWIAQPARQDQGATIVADLCQARDGEYRELLDEVDGIKGPPTKRTLSRLRRQWRRIDKRDHFGASLREEARAAVDTLARAQHPTVPTSELSP